MDPGLEARSNVSGFAHHSVGHQCWHLHDPAHLLHDRQLVAELGDPIKDVYVEFDRALGRILKLEHFPIIRDHIRRRRNSFRIPLV